MLQVERQPKVIGDSQGGPGPPVHLDRKLSLARNPLAVGLPARRRTERGSDSRLANRTAFCSVLIAHCPVPGQGYGYWGAMEQKSSIRKMSNDFLEDVGCAPQRAQLATTYGFWK